MKNETIYFPGLNGLRAIAALAVVISHITISLERFNLSIPLGLTKGWDLAGFGVTIFFALSGFLITYLLLTEKSKSTVHIKYFYLRRILRIWPLYYLYIILVFFVIAVSHLSYPKTSIPYYIFFSANIPFIISVPIPLLHHYWSLGVEEQFYLFWPWILKKTNQTLLVTIIMAGFLIGLQIYFRHVFDQTGFRLPYQIIHVTRFQCMLIGAIGAQLYYANNIVFRLSCNKIIQFISWGVIGVVSINKFHFRHDLDHEIVSVVTVILIYGQITKNGIINLENRTMDTLGKISYGIYVYHPMIMFLSAFLFAKLPLNPAIKFPVIYLSIVVLTILTARFSYEFLEKRFLDLKKKFEIVKSAGSKLGS